MSGIHWANPVSGNFATAGLWTGGVTPGPADTAILDAPGTGNYTVTASAATTVNALQTATNATLDITGGTFTVTSGTGSGASAGAVTVETNTAFAVSGAFDNTGQIDLNNANDSYVTDLIIGAGGVTLSGGGSVVLSDDANNRIYDQNSNGSDILTNVDNTISGAGQFGIGRLTVVNEAKGVIDASDSIALTLDTNGHAVINAGLIEATGAGGLAVVSTTIDDSTGGTLYADASPIRLQSADIIGGTLQDAGGGAFYTTDSGSVLDASTFPIANTGSVDIGANTALTILGAFDNTGQIDLNNANDSYVADLIIGAGGVTLSGGGSVVLSDDANNRIYDQNSNGSDILTNVDNTISGAGQFGIGRLTVVNEAMGVIDASDSIALTLNTNGHAVINSGLIEATGAGGLTIVQTTVDDSTGGTLYANGSPIRLQSADIVGGTLQDAGGGAFYTTDSGSILDASKFPITNTGSVDIGANTALTILGALDNTGQIDLNNANDSYVADLIIGAGGATLSGGGSVVLGDDPNNRIYGNGNTLTNVDNTLSGAGQLGVGQLTLVNDAAGTIDANGTHALILQTNTPVINAGLIEATGAGGLTIASTTVDDSGGGTLYADNSPIRLQSADIVGGTLQDAGGAFYTTDSGSVLDSSKSTISDSATIVIATNTLLTLKGALDNTGQIDLNNANDSYVADLVIGAGGVTLSGGGSVVLSDNPNNRIYGNGNTLTNVDNTLSGAGQLGVGLLTLVNDAGGTIDANGTHALILNTGGNTVVNDGLIEATGAGGLTIASTTVDDSGGGTLYADNSPIRLQSADIVGGTLKEAGNGAFYVVDSGSVLDSTSHVITDAATIVLSTNTLLTVKGPLDNTGQIDLNNANDSYVTDLVIGAGGVTLSGGGSVVLSDDANNRIYGSGNTLTNVDNTISGAGQLGVGLLTLVNDAGGTIDANGTHALILQTNTPVTNDGLIEATGAGGLNIVQTTVDGSGGGTLYADNSPTRLQSADIVGGTLKEAGNGAFYVVDSGSVLDSTSHVITDAATIVLSTNTLLTVKGPLDNTGQIDLNNANDSYVTDLVIGAGGVTLSGGGSVVLSDDANNRIYGSGNTLTNVDNTISGAGQLGVGLLTLVNQATGTIDANGTHALILNTGGNTVVNDGLIEATGAGGLTIDSPVANTGVLEANGGNVTVNGAVSGSGGSALVVSGTIDFTSSFSGNIAFSGLSGVVDLAQSQTFAGAVSGLSNHGDASFDQFDLGDIASATSTATFAGSATSGVLTVTDGAHTANITLIGNYTHSAFDTAGDGHGGTLVFLTGGQTPFAAPDTYNDAVNQTLSVGAASGVLANDVDPNGLALTASLAGGGAPANGSVTVNPDGSFTYTPNAGFVGADTFIYLAKDASGASAQATVTVHVAAAGGPISNPDAYGDGAGQTLTVSAQNGVLANDSDPNGLTLTAALNTAPAHGAVTLNSDGSFTYTPTLGFAGADAFTYVASDGAASGPSTTVTVTVTARPPTSTADTYADRAGQTLAVNSAGGVLANDVDNNGLALTAGLAAGPAHGAVTVNPDGSFNYTPTLGFAGADSFTYVASDSLSSGPPTPVTVTVTASPPTSMADAYSDPANNILTTTAMNGVLANDVDNNGLTLTAAIAAAPAHGTVTLNPDGSFQYTPAAGFTGADSFTYIAADSLASGAPTQVTLTVTGGASGPISTPDFYSDAPGQVLLVPAKRGVLANDTDSNQLPLTASLAPGEGLAHGTLVLAPGGAFRYTPNPGFVGTDTFTYIASDKTSSGAPTLVTITVGAASAAPVSRPDNYTDGAGHTLAVSAASGVLANDFDPNGLALTAALATGPAHGALALNTDGSFSYTPAAGFVGPDSFTYIASDGVASGPPTLVTLNVTAAGPNSKPDIYVDPAGHTLTVAAPTGVLANDTDANGLPLTAVVAAGPSHGALALNKDGSFSYTPSAGFVGPDSFTYIASDGAASGPATLVTVNVTATGPISNPDTYSDAAGRTLAVGAAAGVLANDTDTNGLALAAALATGPAHGALALNKDGSFSYTPAAGFVGVDSFTYIASDGVASGPATLVTLDVTGGGPLSNQDAYAGNENQTLTVSAASGVLANDSDPNGLTLTAALATGPAHGALTLNGDGSFSYTPTAGFIGADTFTYVASDSVASGAATLVTLNIAAASAPTTAPATYNAVDNQLLTVTAQNGVLSGDTDPNGLTMTAALAPHGGPTLGTLTLNSDGSFTYIIHTGFGGFTGTDSFTYIASDGFASSAPTKVTLDITNGAVTGSAIAGPAVAGASTAAQGDPPAPTAVAAASPTPTGFPLVDGASLAFASGANSTGEVGMAHLGLGAQGAAGLGASLPYAIGGETGMGVGMAFPSGEFTGSMDPANALGAAVLSPLASSWHHVA
jgi:VCBS repeat-containing protein